MNDIHLPAWCTDPGDHTDHTAYLGDIDLSEDSALSVLLYKTGDQPTQIQLLHDTPEESRVTGYGLGEALGLRDLIITATTHVLQEVAWSR